MSPKFGTGYRESPWMIDPSLATVTTMRPSVWSLPIAPNQCCPKSPPYESLSQVTPEWRTIITFFKRQPTFDFETQQLYPPPGTAQYGGIRTDPSGLHPSLFEHFHPGYSTSEQNNKIKFRDGGLNSYFAEIEFPAGGTPQLKTREITVSPRANLTGFIRPVPGADFELLPRLSFKVNTIYGIQDWVEHAPGVDEEGRQYEGLRVFKIHYDPVEAQQLSWTERGLKPWPFSYEATLNFWYKSVIYLDVTTFLSSQFGQYDPLVREHLLHACLISARVMRLFWQEE